MAGLKGTSGRRPRFDEEEFERRLGIAWPRKKRVQALQKVIDLASEGNMDAAKLVFLYWVGRPHERTEERSAIRVEIVHSDTVAKKTTKLINDEAAATDEN